MSFNLPKAEILYNFQSGEKNLLSELSIIFKIELLSQCFLKKTLFLSIIFINLRNVYVAVVLWMLTSPVYPIKEHQKLSLGPSGLTRKSVLMSKDPNGPDDDGITSLFSESPLPIKVSVSGYTPRALHVHLMFEGEGDEGGDLQSSILWHDMSINNGSAAEWTQ